MSADSLSSPPADSHPPFAAAPSSSSSSSISPKDREVVDSASSAAQPSPADPDPPFAAAPSSSSSSSPDVEEAVDSASSADQPSPASLTPAQPPPRAQSVRSPSPVSRRPVPLVSGGGKSFLNGRCDVGFSYGYTTFQGKRASMEDYYDARISEVNGQMVAFFGVFDGHGGTKTAEYLKSNLFKNLCSHPAFLNDTKSAIVEAFKQTDAEYLKKQTDQKRHVGSTASTALLLDHRLFVANVGDSRVVASKAGSAVALSVDHKPDRSDERQRIEDAGGFVIWAGTWRVDGILAVSRAFGDKLLKQYVIADPEIQEHEVDGIDFVIIASDGLWNVISNKDAVSIVQNIEGAEAASKKLTKEAYLRGSSDNVTCLVVHFQKSTT